MKKASELETAVRLNSEAFKWCTLSDSNARPSDS